MVVKEFLDVIVQFLKMQTFQQNISSRTHELFSLNNLYRFFYEFILSIIMKCWLPLYRVSNLTVYTGINININSVTLMLSQTLTHARKITFLVASRR